MVASRGAAFEETRERTARVRLVLAVILVLNVAVAVAKLGVGLLAGSLAMIADGFASLLDGASNVLGLIGVTVAARPADPDHPYGHHRFEVLAMLGIAAFMLLTLAEIVDRVWGRIFGGSAPDIGPLAVGVMLVTLAINIGVTIWERREGKNLESPILLADARHTLSDVLVSTSVLISFVFVRLGFGLADIVATFVIAGFIAYGAWQIVREATTSLSDSAVENAERIRDAAVAVEGVEGAHAIRSRDGGSRAWVDLHIQVDPQLSVATGHEIASEVAEAVEDRLGRPADVVVHVEPATPYHLSQLRSYECTRDDSGILERVN
ncbi:MAG: cation diffusion facilitator family transporter [Thermomicrobiales bacterium]